MLSTILVSGWLASTSAVETTAVKAMAVRGMAPGTTAVGTAVRATRAAAAPDGDRVLHVERWLKAVLHHEPGSLDGPASEIAAWSNTDLSTLWIDLKILIMLMRNPRAINFVVKPSGQITSSPASGRAKSLYSSSQEARLRILACAAEGIAGGIVPTNRDSVCFRAVDALDADLRALASAAAEGRGVGADNYVLKRGALLMTDIAILSPGGASMRSPSSRSRSFLVKMSDGQVTGIVDVAVHWEISQTLLDAVRTRIEPAPQRDPMVRDWYRATGAWLLFNRHYLDSHLKHALMLFPDDSVILFLAGSQHEAYATSKVQNVMRSVDLPPGTITPSSDRGELREAESLFRRSIGANGEYAEAHLRLGRVLALQGRFADARPELQKALEIAPNDAISYYGELFLAAVEESLGNLDAAAAGYERAAARFPEAQSPLMALASLSDRRGDRAGARRASDRLFSLPRSTHETPDPWWVYNWFQGVNADQLLDELRRPFASGNADR